MNRRGNVRTRRIGESEDDYQYSLEYWYESSSGYGWRSLQVYNTFAEALNASYRALTVWQKYNARTRKGR